MKNKGFTLIELLAVIIILAVIALIATPLVMNTINDSKKGAAVESARGYIRALENKIETVVINDTSIDLSDASYDGTTLTYTYGRTENGTWVTGTEITEITPEYTGSKPTSVDLKITNGKVSSGTIVTDGYIVKVNGDELTVVEESNSSDNTSSDDTQYIAAKTLMEKANDASITNYSSGDTKEMYTFSHNDTEQLSATTDYRYIGSNPNNYITFNNETWRIVGVFNGKIKIVKEDSIGDISWDYKREGVGSSDIVFGSNDWTDAQLMYMLNPTDYRLKTDYKLDGDYIKDTEGNIIYQLGKLPDAITAGATSYSGNNNTWSLSSEALTYVDDTTWYLGGTSWGGSTHWGNAEEIYTKERGTNVYSGRSTSWTGKVALIYASDYAYTFAYGVDNTCYNDIYTCITRNGATPTMSWLYKTINWQWTLSPYAGSSYSVLRVYGTGIVNDGSAFNAYAVRPSVYLKSNVKLTGLGTEKEPYTIVD